MTASACVAVGIDQYGHQYVTNVGGSTVSKPPVINGEQAVLIWDEAHKIEHFIRQADISTTDPNIGFIVPTPQTPDLVEADPQIFQMVAELSAPQQVPPIVYKTPLEAIAPLAYGPVLWILGAQVKSVFTTIASQLAVAEAGPADESRSVQVISEQDVADYHAVVLAANDAVALGQWLKTNGYAWPPDGDAWLKAYIEHKWKITAFKLLKNPSNSTTTSLSTRAIRMSFTTDRPFFPYSEPGDHPAGLGAADPSGRILHVAVLSNKRMSGKLADGNAWPGTLEFAGSTAPVRLQYAQWSSDWNADQWLSLAKLDPAKDGLSLPTKLSYFADVSNPRPGTADLYFSPDTNSSDFRKVETNYSLTPQIKTRFGDLGSDVTTLLIMTLVPGLIIYSGFRVASGRGAIYKFDPVIGFLTITLGILPGVSYAVLLITIPSVLAVIYCGNELMKRADPNNPPDHRYGILAMATGFALFLCCCYVLEHPFVM